MSSPIDPTSITLGEKLQQKHLSLSLEIWENTVCLGDNFDTIIKSNQAHSKASFRMGRAALTVGPKVNPDFHYPH